MNKTVIGIAAAAVVAIVLVVILVTAQPKEQTTDTTPTNTSTGTNEPTDQSGGAPMTNSSSVTISNRAFSPNAITVKKGTTVTWTNEDSVGHNVVSTADAPAGGPPQEAPLIEKGETFSFTFNTVGTFPYMCNPHPFMQGTVEVVE